MILGLPAQSVFVNSQLELSGSPERSRRIRKDIAMSPNQQNGGFGFIETERTALITGYPDNHFLITRYPDNRHKIHFTKEFVRIYKLFMQNKANFPHFSPKNADFTKNKPNLTQNKPNLSQYKANLL
jgi:hypothetical protein